MPNWEPGLSKALGEYVTVLGDEDGLICVVFDMIAETLPVDFFPDRPWGPGDNPKTAVHEFLKTHGSSFEIDRGIDSKLLISVAPDGYLKRIA